MAVVKSAPGLPRPIAFPRDSSVLGSVAGPDVVDAAMAARMPGTRRPGGWGGAEGLVGWLVFAACVCVQVGRAVAQATDGSVLPFPPTPSASIAAPTLQESTMKWRQEISHLPAGAPNIVIILMDDVGFGLPDTFGSPVHTPTLSRVANVEIGRAHV